MAVQIILQLAEKSFAQVAPTKKQFRKWATVAMCAPVVSAQLQTAKLDLPATKTTIVIRLVGTDEIRELNCRFRSKDCATNILSFPVDKDYWEPGSDMKEIGSLVLCVPVILEEAAQMRIPPEHHWAHMIIHGCLHLLGYDHEKSKDAEIMEDIEAKLLSKLGIANPYGTPTQKEIT